MYLYLYVIKEPQWLKTTLFFFNFRQPTLPVITTMVVLELHWHGFILRVVTVQGKVINLCTVDDDRLENLDYQAIITARRLLIFQEMGIVLEIVTVVRMVTLVGMVTILEMVIVL